MAMIGEAKLASSSSREMPPSWVRCDDKTKKDEKKDDENIVPTDRPTDTAQILEGRGRLAGSLRCYQLSQVRASLERFLLLPEMYAAVPPWALQLNSRSAPKKSKLMCGGEGKEG